MLESGLKQIASRPGGLSKTAYTVVSFIANNSGASPQNRARRLEKLLRIQRIYAEQNPSPLTYRELADTLMRLGKYAESASAYEKLIARYPNEKSVSLLVLLADLHRRSGHNEAVKATLREAMRLDPVRQRRAVQPRVRARRSRSGR